MSYDMRRRSLARYEELKKQGEPFFPNTVFKALKYFPGDLEWIGVAVVPGIAILLLFFLPLLDRGPARHPIQRRLAMNLTALAVLAISLLTLSAYQVTPSTVTAMIAAGPQFGGEAPKPLQPRLTAAQAAGRRIFQSQGCASCHQIGGVGGVAGPDLSKVGAIRDANWLHSYVENPKSINPDARMPAFLPPLTHQEAEWLAQYLSTLR